MRNKIDTIRLRHILLRLGFGVCLFLSQFTSDRLTWFTDNTTMIIIGVILTVAGILLWVWAAIWLRRTKSFKGFTESGPFKYIRHPIYTSIYILCVGLGLIFFAWLWFVAMIIFMPLWYLEGKEEEKRMSELHGQKYADYKARTGMFLLKIW